MEDISFTIPTNTTDETLTLTARIQQIQYRQNQNYYAISIRFLHIDAYIQISSTNDINNDLFQDQNSLTGRLKEGLTYGVHYQVINQHILEEIQSQYKCCIIRVGRNQHYGQRWLIYKQKVSYCFISKNQYERGSEEEELQCKSIDIFPYSDTEEVRLMILRAESLPQYFCGKFSIFPDQLPKNYAKLKQILSPKNKYKLIPYFMLINNPQIFRLKRKFKRYTIFIQPQGQQLLPDMKVQCHVHVFKPSNYGCICLHARSFVCDKFCYDSNKKHNNRCIYVKNKYSNIIEEEKGQYEFKMKKQMGLYNEQNMCFFNTVIQCLTHIQHLTNYFLNKQQSKDLNYWNIDGTYGQVATQYARFIRSYFSTGNQHCNMPLFSTVGRWHPPYAGKSQQDSHEFLIKMLDWLKQDLNRNERKPSYKNIQTDKKSQQQIERQTSFVLKARNSSIIQQLMQGLQKSVIKCLQCNQTSTTFDSFLTVQLAMSGQKRVEQYSKTCIAFYISSMNQQKIKKFKLIYDRDDNINIIKKQTRTSFSKSNDFQIDFYLVDRKGKVQKLNNTNMHDYLSNDDPNQLIYCAQKYKINHKGQNVQIKLVFTGQEQLPFSRPFFINKEIQVQTLYVKILTYIFRCRNQEAIKNQPQLYFNQKFQDNIFPFDLVIRSGGEQIIIPRVKSYKRYCFQQNDVLLVKIRKNSNFSFEKLNYCVSLANKEQQVPKKKFTIVQSTIEDCLKMYCKKEMIEEGRWKCSNCQIKKNAAKTLYFHRLPKILILSINRFKQIASYDFQATHFHKNESIIKYGEYLNMGKFTQSQEDQKYRLYAIAFHIRLDQSLKDVRQMDGHYYAYIRLEKGWMKFDDSSVSQVSEQKVFNNKNAYILFYQKM